MSLTGRAKSWSVFLYLTILLFFYHQHGFLTLKKTFIYYKITHALESCFLIYLLGSRVVKVWIYEEGVYFVINAGLVKFCKAL